MELKLHTHPEVDIDLDSDSGLDELITREDLLQAILAAIHQARPGKCVVLEAQHVPSDVPGFAARTV